MKKFKELIKSWGLTNIILGGTLGGYMTYIFALALINTIKASEDGIGFCDSTILGMGRGAGKVQFVHWALNTWAALSSGRGTAHLSEVMELVLRLSQSLLIPSAV